MIQRFLMVVILFGAGGTLLSKEREAAKPPANWYEDSTCQLVFFAVLEGLYNDGVANETVDLILGKDMKENFVYTCSICHPAYEALRLYRDRKEFYGLKGSVSTFGRGLNGELVKKLHSDNKGEQVQAIQELIRTWVARRVESMHLSKQEQDILSHKMEERRQQGMEALKRGGSNMKTCPFCDGSAEGTKAR